MKLEIEILYHFIHNTILFTYDCILYIEEAYWCQ